MNEVLDKLNVGNFEGFIVGGYVRDYLLNRSSFDIDICTNMDYSKVKKIFPKSKVYKEYLTCHFEKDYYSYEITTYRKESSYVNNKPTVINRCYDLYTDLLRRDFTINAICMNNKGEIVDLLGGVNDLNNKVIKCIGNTYDKFYEDKTRIIRAIRLSSTLDFELSDEIKCFLREKGSLIRCVNKEYIKKELDKIFSGNYKRFFDLVSEYNLKEYLGINYDNIIDSDYYGLWAQIDNSFNTSREDKYRVNAIRRLITSKSITKYDIYKYGDYICLTAAKILNIDITSLIKAMTIKSIFDIDITFGDLVLIIDKNYINKAYRIIEKGILDEKIDNKKECIIDYILKCNIIPKKE